MVLLLFAGAALQFAWTEVYHAVGSQFPGIAQESETGELSGVGVDLARRIATEMGVSLDIQLHPWARALKMIRDHQADLLIGPYRSAERERYMDYSLYPFYVDLIRVYARIDTDLGWDGNLAVLQGKTIGVTRGWAYGRRFERMRPFLRLEKVNRVCYSFRQLVRARIDAVPAMERNADLCISELGIGREVVALEPPIETLGGFFGFAEKPELEAFQARFNRILKRLVKEGAVTRLNQQYGLSFDLEAAKTLAIPR